MHQINCKSAQLCLFTDMDGTVIGHKDYRYEPVLPVLDLLASAQVPVVVNSSKTFAEIQTWLDKLGLAPPFIAENGGVLYLPASEHSVKNAADSKAEGGRAENPIQNLIEKRVLGTPYSQIRAILQTLRQSHDWQFEGFGDMSVEALMAATDLSMKEAQQAMQREVSEPILWQDSEQNLAAFETSLSIAGLQLVRGGRFYHVMGQHDKAKAMLTLINSGQLQTQSGAICDREQVCLVALGDGNNDKAMLQAADIAVVLPATKFNSLKIRPSVKGRPRQVIYAPSQAPEGWAQVVSELLDGMDKP